MSDQMVLDAPTAAPRRRTAAIQAGVILALFVVAGVVSGLVWSRGWHSPQGTVTQSTWIPDDYEAYLRTTFDGSGRMVLWTAGFGLVIGLVSALWLHASELVTVAAVTVGSGLMAVIAHLLAHAGQPGDPTKLAASAADGTVLGAPLTIVDWDPWLTWVPMLVGPILAIGSVALVFLLIVHRPDEPNPVL